ncbi:MAG: DUF4168 domain-containing protein [Sphingomonas bacterium]
MSMMMFKIFGAALVLAAGAGSCLSAQADTVSAPVKAVTDQEVRNYAGAMAALLQLNNAVAARTAVATPTERTAIEQQANAARQTILGRYALDPASFNAISKAVEADPILGDRVRKVMMDTVLGG